MTKMMRVEERELNDVYKAVGAIKSVNRLIRKSVCCDNPDCYVEGAFDAIDIIAYGLTNSLKCAIMEEEVEDESKR